MKERSIESADDITSIVCDGGAFWIGGRPVFASQIVQVKLRDHESGVKVPAFDLSDGSTAVHDPYDPVGDAGAKLYDELLVGVLGSSRFVLEPPPAVVLRADFQDAEHFSFDDSGPAPVSELANAPGKYDDTDGSINPLSYLLSPFEVQVGGPFRGATSAGNHAAQSGSFEALLHPASARVREALPLGNGVPFSDVDVNQSRHEYSTLVPAIGQTRSEFAFAFVLKEFTPSRMNTVRGFQFGLLGPTAEFALTMSSEDQDGTWGLYWDMYWSDENSQDNKFFNHSTLLPDAQAGYRLAFCTDVHTGKGVQTIGAYAVPGDPALPIETLFEDSLPIPTGIHAQSEASAYGTEWRHFYDDVTDSNIQMQDVIMWDKSFEEGNGAGQVAKAIHGLWS